MKVPIFYRVEDSRSNAENLPGFYDIETPNSDVRIRAVNERRKGEELESRFHYQAAESHYLDSLRILSSIGEETSLEWAISARCLSLLYLKRRKVSLAHWYAGRCVAIALRHSPLELEAVKTIAFYGAFLFRIGRYTGAARYLRSAYLHAKRGWGRGMSLAADIADLLVDVYARRNWNGRSASCMRLSRRIRAQGCAA